MSNETANSNQTAAPVVQGGVMPDPCDTCGNLNCAKKINPCADRLWYAHTEVERYKNALHAIAAGGATGCNNELRDIAKSALETENDFRDTLRDRFAMAIAQGMLAGSGDETPSANDLAEYAYRYADAMLIARKA